MLSKSLTESKDEIDRILKQVYQIYFSTLNKLDENSPNNFAKQKRTRILSELNLSPTTLSLFTKDINILAQPQHSSDI